MSDYNVLRVVILLVLGVGRQLASMGDRFAQFSGFLALVCFFVHPAVAGLRASIYKDDEFYFDFCF